MRLLIPWMLSDMFFMLPLTMPVALFMSADRRATLADSSTTRLPISMAMIHSSTKLQTGGVR